MTILQTTKWSGLRRWPVVVWGRSRWRGRIDFHHSSPGFPRRGRFWSRGRKQAAAKCHLRVTFREYFHNRKKYGNDSELYSCKFDILTKFSQCTMAQAIEIKAIKVFKSTKLIHAHCEICIWNIQKWILLIFVVFTRGIPGKTKQIGKWKWKWGQK